MPTSIDLFAGCGGLSLGLGAAGFSTLFAVEAHADAFATYQHNLLDRRPERHQWPDWLDRRAWLAEELVDKHHDELRELRGKVDLIAGGPPCQGFSLNGLRRPDDPRSQMVDVYLKYVHLVRPKLVLLENVVGFLSMKHSTGGTYKEYVAATLERLGYDCWSDVLRAADFGVPQRRPRFILIAARKGILSGVNPFERLRVARKSFLSSRNLGPHPTSAWEALSDLEEGAEQLPLDPEWGARGYKALQLQEVPKSSYQKLMRQNSRGQTTDLRLARHSLANIQMKQEILDTCERGVCLRPDDRQRLGIKKRSTTVLDPQAPAPTISTLPDDLVHYSRPRSMTVREHARLQSFPDWFAFKGPYTTGGERRKTACPKYTQVGNAVPPVLAEALGETLLGLLRVQPGDDFYQFTNKVDMVSEVPSKRGEIGNGDLVIAS